eukprot:TRINITY_DN13618_c0_g1_i1.p1 TRINITY_DN13618_c0_g1~~TRINITY_DN13618_c0_g1_i1.p1  ORF type:complete len:235 (+),score=52.30 TRINITY_DN13618_c0_g1_i1:112-816(+)
MSKSFEFKNLLEQYVNLLKSDDEFEREIFEGLIRNLVETGKSKELYEPAISSYNIEVVELLIENNVDVNIYDKYRPLIYCACYNCPAIAELLIKNNADINGVGDMGITALTISTCNGYYSLAEVLISYNADINKPVKGKEKYSPLQYSLVDGTLDIAELLIDAKADVNYANSEGKTVLHKAVDIAKSKPEYSYIIEKLIKANADPNIGDDDGLTPLEDCNNEIYQIIKSSIITD